MPKEVEVAGVAVGGLSNVDIWMPRKWAPTWMSRCPGSLDQWLGSMGYFTYL